MAKYKYKATQIKFYNFLDLNKKLNELGDNGWKIIYFDFVEKTHSKSSCECVLRKKVYQ